MEIYLSFHFTPAGMCPFTHPCKIAWTKLESSSKTSKRAQLAYAPAVLRKRCIHMWKSDNFKHGRVFLCEECADELFNQLCVNIINLCKCDCLTWFRDTYLCTELQSFKGAMTAHITKACTQLTFCFENVIQTCIFKLSKSYRNQIVNCNKRGFNFFQYFTCIFFFRHDSMAEGKQPKEFLYCLIS